MASRIFKPSEIKEVAEIVAWAVSDNVPLEIVGGGTKRKIGRAGNIEHRLNLSRITGITLYEPEELVLQAKAGTPIADIEHALKKNNQELAFEPADYSQLLAQKRGKATIGGVLATNLSGPRRIKAGAARDHFLGVNAVSGRGEIFKSGGRVVKNVTGYDMCKILAGSWGTLAAMSDVTVKVLPAAEDQASVIVRGLNNEAAIAAMATAMKSDCEVTGAAHLPRAVAKHSNLSSISEAGGAVTLLRLEGVGPSITYRCGRLIDLLKGYGPCDVLKIRGTKQIWREIRDVHFLTEPASRCIWRISTSPSQGAKLVSALKEIGNMPAFFDWAGGLVWLSASSKDDGGAKALRTILANHGGHATLIRAPVSIRAAQDVFQPIESDGIRHLSERLKRGFDPTGILNPGRMYPAY